MLGVSTVTVQAPAPPPASARSTDADAEVGERASSRPNATDCGVAKTSGSTACSSWIMPPPDRVASASVDLVPSAHTGRPVATSADLTCSTVQPGCRARSSAAPPATCGAAMLVPERVPKLPPGWAESTSTPGAVTSGLSARPSGVGPLAEKLARVRSSSAAPTVIARSEDPGEAALPRPSNS